ncbi:MAG: spore gernimation protein GerPD [Paenibacillaceae bacterium]|nr:spore gernimation protein GerPD [Paenibacillaceae bacterium]
MIEMNVTNQGLTVGSIHIVGVGSASVVLIGDTDTVTASSVFDTPPESLIIGPLVPFASSGST